MNIMTLQILKTLKITKILQQKKVEIYFNAESDVMMQTNYPLFNVFNVPKAFNMGKNY